MSGQVPEAHPGRPDPGTWPATPTGPATAGWPDHLPGVITLPSGRTVRGRALRRRVTGPRPEFGLYLLSRAPLPPPPWLHRWIRWPDFRLPRDPQWAGQALRLAWQLAGERLVEVGCAGGRGRTGTAIACLAVLDGLPPAAAIGYVRERYHRGAVETRAQRAFVATFAAAAAVQRAPKVIQTGGAGRVIDAGGGARLRRRRPPHGEPTGPA